MTVNTSCTPTENINEPLVIKTKLMLPVPTCIQWVLTVYLWDTVIYLLEGCYNHKIKKFLSFLAASECAKVL